MSREIVRESGVMMLLGGMRAEERIAAFLLNMSQRLSARGYSPIEFHLRMTREEIGSYLGLKLETVSRALSAFDTAGLISVHLKSVDIRDHAGLKRVVDEPIASSSKARQTKRAFPIPFGPMVARSSIFSHTLAA